MPRSPSGCSDGWGLDFSGGGRWMYCCPVQMSSSGCSDGSGLDFSGGGRWMYCCPVQMSPSGCSDGSGLDFSGGGRWMYCCPVQMSSSGCSDGLCWYFFGVGSFLHRQHGQACRIRRCSRTSGVATGLTSRARLVHRESTARCRACWISCSSFWRRCVCMRMAASLLRCIGMGERMIGSAITENRRVKNCFVSMVQ